jgi:hypothetical protein
MIDECKIWCEVINFIIFIRKIKITPRVSPHTRVVLFT